MWKPHSTSPDEDFEEKSPLINYFSFPFFLDCEQKMFRQLPKSFSTVGKAALYVNKQSFWAEENFSKLFSAFLDLGQKKFDFNNISLLQCFQKRILHHQNNILILLLNVLWFFKRLRNLSEKFLEVQRKDFITVVKTSFNVCKRLFSEIYCYLKKTSLFSSLLDFKQKSSGQMAEKISMVLILALYMYRG